MPHLPSLKRGATLLDVFRMFPETSKPLIQFHEVLLRGASPFSEGERELIATYVSSLNECRYCQGVHSATAERLGVPASALQQLGWNFDAVPEKMQPVLRFARKLTQQPSSVTKADADAVLVAGWDETALYHAVAVTALFNFMNRLVDGDARRPSACPAWGNDVSSTIHASIAPCRSIAGNTISCTLANTSASDHEELATKCKSFWCCAETPAGAVTAAIGSTLLRPSAANNPVQYPFNGAARSPSSTPLRTQRTALHSPRKLGSDPCQLSVR